MNEWNIGLLVSPNRRGERREEHAWKWRCIFVGIKKKLYYDSLICNAI